MPNAELWKASWFIEKLILWAEILLFNTQTDIIRRIAILNLAFSIYHFEFLHIAVRIAIISLISGSMLSNSLSVKYSVLCNNLNQ